MDEQHENEEEQVEDLDPSAEEAEDVKGGFSWGVSQQKFSKLEIGSQKIAPQRNLPGTDGLTSNHNETLVRI
jgi:hypothetical protein